MPEKRKKTVSRCSVFSRCGACKHIDVPYEEQLHKKKEILNDLLGGFSEIEDMVGMRDPHHYRCKVTRVFVQGKGGKIFSGNYHEGSRDIVPVESCLIEDRKADLIIKDITDLLTSFKMKIYNQRTGYGNFRYAMVRKGANTGEIMVILVTRSPIFPSKNNFVNALRKLHPDITTIVQNVNDRTDSLVLSDRNNVLYGKGYIEDSLCRMKFRISPGSFYQVNPLMAEKIYKKAVSFIPDGFKGVVMDAYCGTGTIGLTALKKCENVIGVELSANAVKDAKTNAKINNVKGYSVFTGDAGEFLNNYYEDGGKVDILIMDPPRQGSTPEFIDTIRRLSPEKVIYVSCNPITLKRDLTLLTEPRTDVRGSYKVASITGYDMFPFTEECEACVLLTKPGTI